VCGFLGVGGGEWVGWSWSLRWWWVGGSGSGGVGRHGWVERSRGVWWLWWLGVFEGGFGLFNARFGDLMENL
jgi:hypothetical protein